MTDIDRKREQDAARARKYRRNKKLKQEELAESCDTPLAREFFGLAPKIEDPTLRFATRHDDKLPLVDYSQGGVNGLPGSYTPSPYGVEARKAARAEARSKLSEVIDYGQPVEDFSGLEQKLRDRIIRSLPNSVRRNHVELEQRIAHAMRSSSVAETPEYNESMTWDQVAQHEESAQEAGPETEPYQHSVSFEAPDWYRQAVAQRNRERMAEASETTDAPWSRR